MDALTSRRKAGAKRKLSQLSSGVDSLLAEVTQQLDKAGKGKRLPAGLLEVLKTMM